MSDGDNEEPQFGDGIQELLARGDFAKFPREEGSSRSLTCSRLVDENNLLKPLPKVLIEGTVSASEVLELANVSQDEGMNFETSKVTSPSPSFSKTASGPAVHQPKPRKRREQRISQGGRKGNGGSVRRWLGSVENVAKKVEAHAPLMSNGNKAPLMTNRNTERKAQQPGLRRNLVILNKSESESLVLRILGKDDKLEEKKSLKPGMMLVVEGELAMATPSQMAMKKFSQKCEHEKQATRPRAAGRQASTMQQSRPGDHSGESPAAEYARNSNDKGVRGEGRKMLVRKQINEDESENSLELVEPLVGSMVQQAHQNPGVGSPKAAKKQLELVSPKSVPKMKDRAGGEKVHLKKRKILGDDVAEVTEPKVSKRASIKGGILGVGFKAADLEGYIAGRQVVCGAGKKHKAKACGKCEGCLRENCGLCKFCLDKPCFGGSNLRKQKCQERACTDPQTSRCEACLLD